VLDIRLARRAAGYAGEKLLRQQEITAALEHRAATQVKSLKFLIQGKFVCLQGYMTICCVPKASGEHP
jgi:hypothetical protein